MKRMTVVHRAGRPEGGVQVCDRCGAILIDYRNTMILTSDARDDRSPAWWGVGSFIGTDGCCSFMMSRDAAEIDETICSAQGIQ